MDAVRVYTKYVNARIRVNRLNSLIPVRRNTLVGVKSRGRLPAGGRFIASEVSLGLPCIRIPFGKRREVDLDNCPCNRREYDSDNCPCNEPEPVCRKKPKKVKKIKVSKDTCGPPLRAKPKKPVNKFECKCKCPVIVVPSKFRSKCCWKRKRKSMAASRSQCNVPSTGSIKKCPSSQSSCASKISMRCKRSSSKASTTKECHSKESLATLRCTAKEVEARCVPTCVECEKIPIITKELCMLKQKLELQLAQEIRQKQELNGLNEQLKKVCSTVRVLNEKCKVLETEKEKIAKQQTSVKCACLKKSSSKCVHHRLNIERKASSLCQFCKNKTLPILNTMHSALFKVMGRRSFQDIVLTILLRADDIYHVNVRDLCTGSVLGCLLVTDAGIRESNCLGLFQEIITFCVIDVRSTINAKDAIFGCINFEFIQHHRLSGGNVLEDFDVLPSNDLCTYDVDVASQEDVQPQPVPKTSQPEPELSSKDKTQPTVTKSRVIREINNYSSNLVLEDTETKYAVRHVRIAS